MSQISLKSYITSMMLKNFTSLKKIDKYFRVNITNSMSKAIEENWIRILGIDYEIISLNLLKNNEPLGISLEGRNVYNADTKDFTMRHYLRAIRPNLCIGSTNQFLVGDELLEVNGFKIHGMSSKDVVRALKKLPMYIQFVVARSLHPQPDEISDNCDINEPISFYDTDDDDCSRTSTLKSNSSLFSMTSRDFGSNASVGGLIDGRYKNVSEYLRGIIGWRGPIVLEFKKQSKESIGLALEELKDPQSSELIIVFKIIVSHSKAANDGRLHVGDRLLQVNGKTVIGASFRKVCQWIKSALGGRLVLYICKPHFPNSNMDCVDHAPDSYLSNTLTESDKLPKLREETDNDGNEIPPVPESYENSLSIEKNDDKLGLFLDIVDNGKNGCRIKKMTKGLAKESGLLHEGDYVTKINGISLRVDEKNKLENCLRTISKSDSDFFKINYLTKEDVEIHRSKYEDKERSNGAVPPVTNLYPDTSNLSPVKIESLQKNNAYDEPVPPTKASFETFKITIDNDGTKTLGLILFPSLNDPTRYVAITGIHEGSLAEQSGQLKINDEIISVNDRSLEYMTPSDCGMYLKKQMMVEDTLQFKVKRLISSDDECSNQSNDTAALESSLAHLSHLPDIYLCSLKKSHLGYGFSVQELHSDSGVIVKDVEMNSAAFQTGKLKPGHRFLMLNNSPLITSPLDVFIKTVKGSKHTANFIMETSKFREFDVEIVKDSTNSLGLNVIGGIDTKFPLATIESILPHTTCQFSEKLQANDVIFTVNDISMLNLSHDDIINILRKLPRENTFRMLRKLPFIKRDLLNNILSSSFLQTYTESCLFSVTINKPVNSIPTYGINFADVVIFDHNCTGVICRYKIVLSIDGGSLFEKYAPEVTASYFLIEVNKSPVDVAQSCADLKRMVDSQSRVELLFSRDVPYSASESEHIFSPVVLTTVDDGSQRSSISDVDPRGVEGIPEAISKKVHFQDSGDVRSAEKGDGFVISPVEIKFDTAGNELYVESSNDKHLSPKDVETVNNADEVGFSPENEAMSENCLILVEDPHTNVVVEPMVESAMLSPDESQLIPDKASEVNNIISGEECDQMSGESDSDDSSERKHILEGKEFIPSNEDNEPNNRATEDAVHSSEVGDDVMQPVVESKDQRVNSNDDIESEPIRCDLPSEIGNNDAKSEYPENKQTVNSPNETDDVKEHIVEDRELEGSHDTEDVESDSEPPPNDETKDGVDNDTSSTPEDIEKETSANENDRDAPPVDYEATPHISPVKRSEESLVPHEDCHGSLDNGPADVIDDDCQTSADNDSDFSIEIDKIVVAKLENTELGIRVYGGRGGGPEGETLPVYVVSVERGTCNWPKDREEPLLSNGYQLLELNGCNLSTFDALSVEKLLASTEGDLEFKVVKFK